MRDERLRFDADRNLITLGDRRLVFHCHHYNLFLQRTIEDGLGLEAAHSLQVAAGMEATRQMLSSLFAGDDSATYADKLEVAKRIFAATGFGQADLAALTPQGGAVRLDLSHYAIGWKSKWGDSKHPVCHYPTGFWMGALSAATGLAPERLQGRELSCAASGSVFCELAIEVL